ncbi:glycosyltransferase [Halorarius halobius]|uniref:glycosyltransferase n=1 Tax=Halorarius halobius TaxID=2962671 RepID=UPI0020CC6DEB|nr:glycosyltransferase [Halorarius halobius]
MKVPRLSPRETVEHACSAGFTGVVLWSALLRGIQVLALRVDLLAVVLVVAVTEAVVSATLFTLLTAGSGLLLAAQVSLGGRGDAPTPTDERVTAVVPVYRDSEVLHRSVESLLASTQPVRVVVACEPDDSASLARARELARDRPVEVFVNDVTPGSKAGAVNAAVSVADATYVAVFDADERVHPEFLAAAVDRLEDGAEAVQGRTVPGATGFVEALSYVESVLLSYAGRRPLYLLTDFRMAASRAVVFERAAFERVGGYDETLLTEDYEFAHRCYREGVEVEELVGYPSRIEAAHSLVDWWGQRKRWMTGYVQTAHHLLGSAIPPRSHRDELSVVVAAGTLLGSLLMVGLAAKLFVLVALGGAPWVLMPLGSLALAVGAVRLADRANGAVDRLGWRWLLVPALLPVFGIAAIKALFEYLLSWDGDWYRVAKTDA